MFILTENRSRDVTVYSYSVSKKVRPSSALTLNKYSLETLLLHSIFLTNARIVRMTEPQRLQ